MHSLLPCSLFALSFALPALAQIEVVNSATFERFRPLAPLTIATAFGDFNGVTQASAATVPLPTSLGGAQLTVGGTAAQLLYTSPEQINFIVPAGVRSGLARVIVSAGNTTVAESSVEIEPSAPSLFLQSFEAARPVLALLPSGAAVSESNRAARGQTVTVLATGLGAEPSPDSVGAMLALHRVDAAAITADPAFPGLWRIQIAIPESGEGLRGQIPMAIYAGGSSSNTVSLWLQQ